MNMNNETNKKPKPTHPGNKMKKLMRVWRLEGLPDMPRWSINTPEGYDANFLKPYGGALACAPVIDGKLDARNVEVWNTAERVMRWCEGVTRNTTALAASDLKGIDPKQINKATAAVMGLAKEMRELCATASRAMLLECAAVNALTETNATTKKG